MYNISDNYKSACKALTRQSRTKIVIDNITYDGSKYIKSYPKFSQINDSMIGGFPIKSAEFSLWIKEGNIDLTNKEIKIYRGLIIDNSIEWIPQGIFFAQNEDVSTSDTGDYINVKCYDKAKEAGTKKYVDKNTYPISETNYIKNVISQSGYELDEDFFVESDYIMNQKPNLGDSSFVREIISRYAEQRGAIALFSRLGKVQIKRPKKVNFIYKNYEYKKLLCEKIYGPIDQVIIGNEKINNNVIYPAGEKVFPWTINDNPFLDLLKLDRNSEIYSQVHGLSLTPFNLESTLDSFCLDINDIISVQKKDGTYQDLTILSIVTENRLKCKLGASVQNKKSINYNLAGSVKDELKKVEFNVDYQNKKIEALASDVSDSKEKIAKLEISTEGITQTVDSLDKNYKQNINTSNELEGNPVIIEDAGNYDLDSIEIDGSYYQNGIPSFDNPAPIKVVTPQNDGFLYLTAFGNNLFDGQLEVGSYDRESGIKQPDSGQKRNVNPIPVIPGESYIFSNNGAGVAMFIYEYDADRNFIKFSGVWAANKAYKVSDSTHYINFCRVANVDISKIQVNIGTKILPYEEYKSSVAKIDLNRYDNDGNKIGSYRLISGPNKKDTFIDGTLTKRISVLTLNGSENWKIYRDVDTSVEMFAPVLKGGAKVGKNKILCDRLPAKYNDTTADEHIRNAGSANSENLLITINKSRLDTTSNSSMVNSFKTLLNQNNVVVYYELENDETYQISYEKLKLFKDFNYLSLSSQIASMKVKYLTDSILNGTFASHGELKVTADSISEKLSGEIKDSEGNTKQFVTNELDRRISADGASVSDILTRHTTDVINPAIKDAKDGAIKEANSSADTKLKDYLKETDVENRVERIITDDLNQSTSKLSTTITESAKEISANAVDAKFNNIAVEGCVVPYNNNEKTYVTYNDYFNTGNIIVERLANIENEGPILEHGIKFIKDKFYTISFDLRVFIGDVNKLYVYNGCSYLNSVVLIDGENKGTFNQSIDFPTDKTRHKIELRFKAVDNADYNTINVHHLILQMNKATTDAYRIGIYNYKIEEGIGKTKWEPCFKSLSTTKEMTNVIDRKITDKENSIIASVSETYETKENVTNKLKDYSTTKQVEAKLELKVDNTEYNKIVSMLNAAADEITLDGGSKIHLKSAGSLLIDAGNFKLDTNGTATLVNGIFSGKITSTSGKIGGWNISANRIYSVENNDCETMIINGDDSVNNFLVVKDKRNPENPKYPFVVKTTGKLYARDADIVGKITATSGSFKGSIDASSGKIGGWTINEHEINSGDNLSGYRTHIRDCTNQYKDFLVIYDLNDNGKATFAVNGEGHLYATDADITGTIHSSSGTIGGLTINGGNGLDNGNFTARPTGELYLYPKVGNGGVYLFNDGMRLNSTKGMSIASSSDGNRVAPSSGGIDIMACSGTEVYLACKLGSNASGTGSSVTCKNGVLALYSSGHFTVNGVATNLGSSIKMKKNIVNLTQVQKDEVYELIKNIQMKQYDYKQKYGPLFNYGFIIEDIENTKLNKLLHITQNEENEEMKLYSSEDLTRLELIVIQELMKKIERLEEKLCQ